MGPGGEGYYRNREPGARPQFVLLPGSCGNEVDILYKRANLFTPAEIKVASTYTGDFLKGILKLNKNIPDAAGDGYIIYSGKQEMKVEGDQLLNYKNSGRIISER